MSSIEDQVRQLKWRLALQSRELQLARTLVQLVSLECPQPGIGIADCNKAEWAEFCAQGKAAREKKLQDDGARLRRRLHRLHQIGDRLGYKPHKPRQLFRAQVYKDRLNFEEWIRSSKR